MDTTSLSLDLDQHHASRWQARCCASVEIVKDRMELEQVDSAYYGTVANRTDWKSE